MTSVISGFLTILFYLIFKDAMMTFNFVLIALFFMSLNFLLNSIVQWLNLQNEAFLKATAAQKYNELVKKNNSLVDDYENIRHQLIIQTIVSLHFSMLLAARIKNKQMFEKAQKELVEIGVDHKILQDAMIFSKFIQDLRNQKYNIITDSKQKKIRFQLKTNK